MATDDPPTLADPCTQWRFEDGAYVLGALSPAERHAFQEHLSRCGRCRDNLVSLAGLPGLLARLRRTTLDGRSTEGR